MRRIMILTLLACALAVTAAAAFIPDNEVSENRNGQQLIIRTYTLSPDDDPAPLTNAAFEREGYAYSCLSIVKEEKPYERRKHHSETVTVETRSGDLAVILGELDATLLFTDGEYSGALAMDHTSLRTEATGYSSRSYTVSDTKVFDGLELNDPSYIPRSTIKDGVTLSLQNIEWAVQSAALSGGELIPSLYTARAAYSANALYSVADGYITTVTYTGEVVSTGISSIVYTVTYYGEPIPSPIPMPAPKQETAPESGPEAVQETKPEPKRTPIALYIICACAVLGLLAAILNAAACFALRRNSVNTAGSAGNNNIMLNKPMIEEDAK